MGDLADQPVLVDYRIAVLQAAAAAFIDNQLIGERIFAVGNHFGGGHGLNAVLLQAAQCLQFLQLALLLLRLLRQHFQTAVFFQKLPVACQ